MDTWFMDKAQEIQEIEKDIIINPTTSRFNGADWFDELNMPEVFVIGLGNLGSWISLGLARMNCKVHLYDDDKIEEGNLGCQFYDSRDIGKRKSLQTMVNSNVFSGNSN